MRPPEGVRSGVAAIGLDLGSSWLKAGLLDDRGCLMHVASVAAPPLQGTGAIREGDAEAYARAARELLESLCRRAPSGTPLGISSQRSSFTIWDSRSGKPLPPLISWQDRRGGAWCASRRSLEPEVARRTGLLLSGHYVGPKLAALQENAGHLRRVLRAGHCLLGNLETYLLWHWSSRSAHETDLTMAARTLLVDLASADWSMELMRAFDVPAEILPRVVSSAGRQVDLELGATLTASLADQAAGALAVLERLDPRPTELPSSDPSPQAFSLPDEAGLGAPHWRADLGLTLSPAASQLDRREQRRIVLEGLLFRIAEVLDDLCQPALPQRILISGGLSRDPATGKGLAALLGRPIELVEEHEAALLGAARLAAGFAPCAEPRTIAIEPGPAGGYLADKYLRWRQWLAGLLAPRSD